MRKETQKKPKVFRLFIYSFLILGVIGVSLFFFTDIFDEIAEIAEKEPGITVETKSERIENGIELEIESKKAKTYTSYIAYPRTNLQTIDLPIYEWVSNQADNFYQEMEETEILLGNEFEAHLGIQSDITAINEDIMSFLISSEQHVEQENEYKIIQSFMVNLKEENIINFSDILDEEKIEDDQLFTLLRENLDNNKIDDKLLRTYVDDPDNIKWLLDQESIVFYFNPFEISNDEKVMNVAIPLIDVYMFFKEDYRSILFTKKLQAEIDRIEELKQLTERELDPNGKYIALTFDDGPNKHTTPRILETLKQYDAKATFYMLSGNATNLPELARQVAEEGHEIANHSITHANLNTLSSDGVKKEVKESMEQIEQATGVKPKTFRPPYGNYNDRVIDNAIETDQSIVLWTIDTRDWQHRNAKSTYESIVDEVKSGSIVLMHDIHATTADALPKMLEYLSEEGFEFVTVSELLPLLSTEAVGPHYGKK